MSDSAATPADFELGRSALLDITPANTIGEPAGSIDEGDGVISVYFESTMRGYPGWRWTVSIAHVDGAEPTVLETELTPGEHALLSPDWVPWADRLADYKAGQAELAGVELEGDDTGDDDEDLDDIDEDDDDDDTDDDDDDFDDGVALLHSGDLDGVDIDELEDELDDEDDDDDDDEDDADEDDVDADESAPQVGVDQSDESEREADDASPEPPAAARGKQRGKKQEDR